MSENVYAEALEWFKRKQRPSDHGPELSESYWSLREGAPSELLDMVREAHEGRLPNDSDWSLAREAVEFLTEAEDQGLDDLAHEFADGVDVYTSDLLAWVGALGSHALMYADEATSELGQADSTEATLRQGQYLWRQRAFWVAVRGIKAFEDSRTSA